ncbi:MAG: hypothetical protein K0R09_1286 [Clostridiales bacterium]|nr:hypothetical protein [Clostridiales bacterium]
MPKFNDSEKEIIHNNLLREGEKLFAAHGLKKVTVDDLVQAVGIAKGSFYTFYINKEHLYMDISQNIQQQMWSELDSFLSMNSNLPPKELTKQVFFWMLEFSEHYPILSQINSATLDYLIRKLPQEVIEKHTQEDSDALKKLSDFGVSFTCESDFAAIVLQTVYFSIVRLKEEDKETRQAVTEVLINGVIDQIVRD